MRAMRLHEIGGELRLDDVPPPEPGPGEALLRVRACGVNFADTLMVAGRYQEKPALPFAPGMEVCGVVEALGPGAEGAAVGDRVAAICGSGGFADHVAAPAAACVAVPDAMGDAEAAAFQIAYGTSHLALDHLAGLRPGERLVVTGAAGGVGLTAVEIGKLMGAEVVACARDAEKLAVAAAKGADHLIEADPDVLRERVKALGGADVFYETVGSPLWEACVRSARFRARLLPIGFAGGEVPKIPANVLLVKNLSVLGLYWGAYAREAPEALGASLGALLAWWSEGRLIPHVSHRLPLERAAEALALLRSRAATGKVVVEMAG